MFVAPVLTVWAGIDAALRDGHSDFLRGLEDWNLDTSRNLLDQQLVFWKVKK